MYTFCDNKSHFLYMLSCCKNKEVDWFKVNFMMYLIQYLAKQEQLMVFDYNFLKWNCTPHSKDFYRDLHEWNRKLCGSFIELKGMKHISPTVNFDNKYILKHYDTCGLKINPYEEKTVKGILKSVPAEIKELIQEVVTMLEDKTRKETALIVEKLTNYAQVEIGKIALRGMTSSSTSNKPQDFTSCFQQEANMEV